MATIELPDMDTLDAFLEVIEEALDAEEFERLMGETEGARVRSFNENMTSIRVLLNVMQVRDLIRDLDSGEEPSALTQLKARRALDDLREHYAELWERAATCTDEAA